MAWYVVAENSEAVGPVEDDLIERGILTGKIPLDAQICAVGDTQWKSMASVKSFADAMRAVAPPPPAPGRTNPPKGDRRSYATLSEIYPVATSAPPYIPGPGRLPAFDGHQQPASRRRTDPPKPFGHAGGGGQQYAQQPAAQQVQQVQQVQQAQPAPVQPAAPIHANSPTVPPAAMQQPVFLETPKGPLLAAIALTAVGAVFWFLVMLIRILGTPQLTDLGFPAILNLAIVGLDIWITAALWGRKRVGYTFGLAAHLLSAGLGLYHLFGSTPFIILIVPVHAFASATIWSARHELSPPQAADGPSAAKISAQKLADLDTTRVLLGIAGIVAIAISILFLIFLARQQ
jgi:hypothetical protein